MKKVVIVLKKELYRVFSDKYSSFPCLSCRRC